MSTIKLYRHPLSGHAHRAELFLSILGLNAEIIDVDLMSGEHKKAEFLTKNIFGQVPVLEDDDVTIADSNAILVYLASQYDQDHTWLPIEPAIAAEVQRFLSVAAGPIASGPATARLINLFGAKLDHVKAIETAHNVLSTLDEHLEGREWLANDHPTIADLSNYPYIAHAPEGDVSLQHYPNVRAWLQRIEKLPGFIAMQSSQVGLAA
ncbi:MAG: glutathione S-transferase [Methylococcaceae bacterium]|nr:glutathione S-transferase [Methylococcaceae bacterium]